MVMKIHLDLKDFEQILALGVKAMFKENASITDVVTPFGTFHINPSLEKRRHIFDEILSYIQKDSLISAVKAFRINTGVGLKAAKDFCEKFRDNEDFRNAWRKGDDTAALKLFHYDDLNSYNMWKVRMED